MILIWMVPIALVLAVVVALLFSGMRAGKVDAGDLAQQLRSVDVDAFLNLVDYREEAYLREHLPARVFRKIHRERMLAAAQYSWHAAGNARLLMRFAELARPVSDSTSAGAAARLYAEALDLRVRALQMSVRLVLRAVVPGWKEQPEAFASRYYSATHWFLAIAHQQTAEVVLRAA